MTDLFDRIPQANMTFDLPMSEETFSLLIGEMKDRREISIVSILHYPRWYRFVIAVLCFAYGWLGYKEPPKEIRTVLPNMKITKVEASNIRSTIHVEARMEWP